MRLARSLSPFRPIILLKSIERERASGRAIERVRLFLPDLSWRYECETAAEERGERERQQSFNKHNCGSILTIRHHNWGSESDRGEEEGAATMLCGKGLSDPYHRFRRSRGWPIMRESNTRTRTASEEGTFSWE